jgi:hypothetical protein
MFEDARHPCISDDGNANPGTTAHEEQAVSPRSMIVPLLADG